MTPQPAPRPTAWPASRRRFLAHGAAALAAAGTLPGLATATAAPWHLLSSGPPGSVPDTVARRVAEQLGRLDGQGVIVDNRPGAAGQLAVAALNAGPADGSTLLLAQGAIATVHPYLYPGLAQAAGAALAPVSLAGEMTLALAVGPAVPDTVTGVRELVAWLRAHPERANLGSPGSGTLPHLLAAMLMHQAATPWQHIAYTGGPQALVALLGGQIAALILPEGLLAPQRAAARLRVLASSGAQRSALLPDVPTLAELGYADLVVREWFAFFMSGRVAPALVEARSRSLRGALAQPELAAQFAAAGMLAAGSTPAALQARIATEQRYWEPVIRALGVRGE